MSEKPPMEEDRTAVASKRGNSENGKLSNIQQSKAGPPVPASFTKQHQSPLNNTVIPTPPPPKGRKSKYAMNQWRIKQTEQLRAQIKLADSIRDARTPPSAESGGIPDATEAYLSQSSQTPSSLPTPRRILVIIDLNGTLLHRPSKRNPTNFVARPHAKQFLQYCIDTFVVGIWSSARPQNVTHMVAALLTPEQRAKCVTIWSRDHFDLTPVDYAARVQCYKRLTRVWADDLVQASHPDFAEGRRWDQSNTVLLDDSSEKARSEPHNLLKIPEFSGLQNETAQVLPQAHDYLNKLCHQQDVSSYMRAEPFKLDPAYKLQAVRNT